RLLLRDRAGEGQGDEGDVRRRGVRDAVAPVSLPAPVRAGTDLPRRRPRRSRCADLAAARRRARGVRPNRLHPRRRPRGGLDSRAEMSTPDVRLVDVTKRFDDVVAVDDLSLDVESGSFFALLGPSGCGKTTTLRMIGGFEQPSEGRIFLGDREVSGLPAYKRDVNTVFQSYALFPHLSVLENVAFGLRRRGLKGKEVRERVREILRVVGP